MGYRICVVVLLGFCLGLLSGCDQPSLDTRVYNLQSDFQDHKFSLAELWDEIELLKADAESLRQCRAKTDAEPFAHAMNFAQQQFLKCDHRLTELEHAITTLSSGLAKRIEEQGNSLEHTTAKADCAYDNNTALAAKLQKLEAEIARLVAATAQAEKDHAEFVAVIEHHEKAIEELGSMVASATPPPAPVQTPPAVVVNHADTKPLNVVPIRCPTGKCPKR